MSDLSIAQDPRELFDVVTFDGRPTGRVKARGDVHRDGDWHRALHVWVVGVDGGGPFLTFQRRSLAKDTWGGRLDATVGGHFRAGETLEQTLREIDEEIGASIPLAALTPLGLRLSVNEGEPGTVDHELQDVFLLRDDRPLTEFRPNPAELAALVRFPLDALLAFLAEDAATVAGMTCASGSSSVARLVATADDFIPQIDGYFYRVAISAMHALRGERHVSI